MSSQPYMTCGELVRLASQFPPDHPVYVIAYEETPCPLPARFEDGNFIGGHPAVVLTPLSEEEFEELIQQGG